MDISNINKISPNQIRLLLLKKIKLKNHPELNTNLKDYFWTKDKYFNPKSEKYNILVGKKTETKTIIPYITKKKIERRNTKFFYNIDKKNLNNSRRSLANNNSYISFYNNKRVNSPNKKEFGLKLGQRYITDFELEDIFNNFRNIHKLNKKKIYNFISSKEYIFNNSFKTLNKTTSNFGHFMKDKILLNIGEHGEKKLFSPKKDNDNNINNDYYKTTTTLISNNQSKNIKDHIINESNNNNNKFYSISKINLLNNPINIDNNKLNINKKSKTSKDFFKFKTIEDKNISLRNKLIKKQDQFLLNSKEELKLSPHKTQRTIFAKLLANQEQTLSKTTKNKRKSNNIYNLLSKKAHKSKEKLLMTNINSFRVKNELKDQFCVLNTKIQPEHSYKWINSLREISNINKTNENNINSYTIRDPFCKTINIYSNKKITNKKNNIFFKKLIEESNKMNNNLEGMYINGKNLLIAEYEHFKSMKNRKIINNFEKCLPLDDVNDILFTDKKYFCKKKIIKKKKY